MSRDRFDVLERFAPLFEAPDPSFERFLHRRDRKRRNQRIAAGVVGIAFFVAAVWIVTTGGAFDRTRTPASTGPTVAPDVTGPVGLIGLPPEGATPSTPERGELVLIAVFGHSGGDPGRFHFNVYADGRLIWQRLGGGTDEYAIGYTTGFLEQRLTPEGVELLRSEALSIGLFEHDLRLVGAYVPYAGEVSVRNGDRLVSVTWGDCCDPSSQDIAEEMPTEEQASALQQLDARLADPASWLPASAWEDQEPQPFVPSRYSVCYEAAQGIRLDRVLSSLPRPAEDVLRPLDRTHGEYGGPSGTAYDSWCSAVTTDRARALAEILDDADIHSSDDIFGLYYDSGPLNGSALNVSISFELLLPHET